MPGEPTVWNVVLIGAWNVAILSPDGVRRRLFELADGTPIELQVSVDQPGHFRISHGGVVVVPTPTRLEAAAPDGTVETLRRAAQVCQKALSDLPQTPVTAAGVNIRYRFPELSDGVLNRVRAPLDAALAQAGHQVRDAAIRRTIEVGSGVVNVQINHTPSGAGMFEFNFHRESRNTADLADWIGRIDEFLGLSRQLATAIGVDDVG